MTSVIKEAVKRPGLLVLQPEILVVNITGMQLLRENWESFPNLSTNHQLGRTLVAVMGVAW